MKIFMGITILVQVLILIMTLVNRLSITTIESKVFKKK